MPDSLHNSRKKSFEWVLCIITIGLCHWSSYRKLGNNFTSLSLFLIYLVIVMYYQSHLAASCNLHRIIEDACDNFKGEVSTLVSIYSELSLIYGYGCILSYIYKIHRLSLTIPGWTVLNWTQGPFLPDDLFILASILNAPNSCNLFLLLAFLLPFFRRTII